MEVGIGGLEALQLGVDGSELAAEKVPSRGSSTTNSDLLANFSNGKLLHRHMFDLLET